MEGGREGGRAYLSVEGPGGGHPVGDEALVLAHVVQNGLVALKEGGGREGGRGG